MLPGSSTVRPENWPRTPKKKRQTFSKHHFSGAFAVKLRERIDLYPKGKASQPVLFNLQLAWKNPFVKFSSIRSKSQTTPTTTSITETVVTSTTTMTVKSQQDDEEDNGSNVSN